MSAACLVCGAELSLALDGAGARVCRRSACQWAFRTTPRHLVCAVCGRPLTARQAAERVCGDPACRAVRAAETNRNRDAYFARRRAEHAASAMQLRDERAAGLGVAASDEYLPTEVPGFKPTFSRFPAKRRDDLRAHLNAVIEAAAGLGPTVDVPVTHHYDLEPDPTREMAPELAAILGKSCGRCRGQCCSFGGNHAYIRADAMARYMAANPEKSREAIVDDYLAHVGERTVTDSCAFHGEGGCTLPREMRSNICNSFYCTGLVALRDAVRAGAPPRAFVFTSRDEKIEGAFVDAREVRVVRRRPRPPANEISNENPPMTPTA